MNSLLNYLLLLSFLVPSLLVAQDHDRMELVKPFERSDLELHLREITPAYPVPGESVTLVLELINNQEFPENQIEASFYKLNYLLDQQEMRLNPRESKQVKFEFTAPEEEGVYNYSVEIDSQNSLDDANLSDNTISFDILASFPKEQCDFSLTTLSLVSEPEQVPGILLEVENKGAISGSVPLELIVNKKEVIKKWIQNLEPAEIRSLFLPYTEVGKIGELRVRINPRFSRRETSSSDNVLSKDFRPAMDLIIEDLFINAPKFEVEEKRLLTVNFTIRNKGRLPVREDFTTRIKLSLFDDDDRPEFFINSEGRIAPGEAIYVSKEIEGFPDEFYVRVVADVHQKILEDNKENNIASTYYRNPLPNVRRWYSIGPDKVLDKGLNATGRLFHMAIDPTNSNVIFVGGSSGSGGSGTGVWKTKDGGKHWFPITDALGFQMVNALAIDPKNSSRVILGTAHSHRDSCYLWESLNSGSSWKKLATIDTPLKGSSIILFDPLTWDMYLTSRDGIYKSTDNGRSWTRTLTGSIYDLVMDPNSSANLYAAYKGDSLYQVYRSEKRGVAGSWSPLKGCGSKMLPVVVDGDMGLAISGSTLFASYMVDTVFSIYKTTNKKCSGNKEPKWEKVLEKPIKTILTTLEADPKNPNNLYAYWGGPSSIWVSHDGGKTIKEVGGKAPHVDTHGFAFDPQNSKIVYVLSDGGIFKSTDRGKDGTWSFIGEGIRNSEIYYMAGIQSDPETLIAGTQDNGNISKQKQSKDWKVISGAEGDGAYVAIHPTNKDEFYTMHQHGQTLRKHSKAGIISIGCGYYPCAKFSHFFFTIVPDDPQRLLVYYNDTLWTAKNPNCAVRAECFGKKKTLGSANVWSVLWKTPANSGSIKRVLIDDKLDIFYAGTSSGLVYYSEDRGGSFDTTTALTFRASIFDMALNPDTPQHLYVAYNTTGTNRIHLFERYSANNNLSFSARDITFGFPVGLKALTLAVDPITPFVLYAGTKDGVYRGQSFDNGKSWIWKSYKNGIAKGTHISDLEIYQKTGLLRAATKGRGVYSIRNYDDDIFVEIVPASQEVEPGKAFNYTIKIDNKGASSSNFKLSVSGLEEFQYGFGTSTISLAPGTQGTTTLSVQVPKCFYHQKSKYVFTVRAHKISNPLAYSQANGLLLVKTPDRQLTPDSYENNNSPDSAKTVSVTLNQSAPWNQTPAQIKDLNLHYSLDSDYFKIDFNSNSQAECAGSGPKKFGSFISSFRPEYYPGNMTISVQEEFCRPMDVSIFSFDSANPGKIIPWGTYKTSETISITCPSQAFIASEFYIKIWRSEGDKVKYDMKLTLNPWVITLKRPDYELGDLRYNLPPHLRDWEPEWRWFDIREQLDIFQDRIRELRELENIFTEGQVIKLRADMEITTGSLDEGEALLSHSQEIFEGMGAVSAMGDVFLSRANIAAKLGHMGEAHEFTQLAMEHHREAENREAFMEDIRQLMFLRADPGSLAQAMHLVQEMYLQDAMREDPTPRMESLELLTELLLQNREVAGAMAGLVSLEQRGIGVDDPTNQRIAELEHHLKQLLGTDGFQELKSSIGPNPEAILEIELGHTFERY